MNNGPPLSCLSSLSLIRQFVKQFLQLPVVPIFKILNGNLPLRHWRSILLLLAGIQPSSLGPFDHSPSWRRIRALFTIHSEKLAQVSLLRQLCSMPVIPRRPPRAKAPNSQRVTFLSFSTESSTESDAFICGRPYLLSRLGIRLGSRRLSSRSQPQPPDARQKWWFPAL